jgi:hypothetical protein
MVRLSLCEGVVYRVCIRMQIQMFICDASYSDVHAYMSSLVYTSQSGMFSTRVARWPSDRSVASGVFDREKMTRPIVTRFQID